MRIKTKVKRFVKFLKKVLIESEEINPSDLSDEQILEIFRNCFGCGEELVTISQQMHSIIEFDSPERAFEVIKEIADKSLKNHN